MANRRAYYTQSELTKVLKAYRDAGYPAPSLVIEAERITALPNYVQSTVGQNPWDKK